MAAEITDLEQMMKTLEQASTDPKAVSVGDFAKAVQSLQAELKMLESEVSKLSGAVDTAFKGDVSESKSAGDADAVTATDIEPAAETSPPAEA